MNSDARPTRELNELCEKSHMHIKFGGRGDGGNPTWTMCVTINESRAQIWREVSRTF